MKVDFSQELKSLDGKPFEKEPGVNANLGDMCVTALLTEVPKEPATPEDKLKRWELAKRLYEQKEVEVTAEDIALIKKMAGKVFLPALMGTLYDVLESK